MFNRIFRGFLLGAIMLFLFLPQEAFAQVVINEFNSWETSGDWVELYAYEDTDISGWLLRDLAASEMYTVPQGTAIGPSSNQFYIAEVGNRLNKDDDTIKLLKNDDTTVIDQIRYGDEGNVCAPGTGQSAGRYPDANSTIERFETQTKGASNNSATLSPCPTPSPEPTNTPTPTPKPTATPKPTSTPTKTPTPSPASTPTLEDENESQEALNDGSNAESGQSLALGVGTSQETSPSPSPSPDAGGGSRFPLMAGLMIVAGVGFIGAAGYPFIRKRLKGYNLESEESA